MRSLRNWLVGTTLAGILACLTSGCGGGSGDLAKPPEATGAPDMSKMPGYDTKTGKMQTAPTK